MIFVNFQKTSAAKELGSDVPERSVLESLKKNGYKVTCKFYKHSLGDQNAPSLQGGPPVYVMEESMDSIVKLYEAGLLVWVANDTVLLSGNPTTTFVEKGKKVKEPITVMSKSAYKAGKSGGKSLSLKTSKQLQKEHQKKQASPEYLASVLKTKTINGKKLVIFKKQQDALVKAA